MPSDVITCKESEDTAGGLTYSRGFLSGYSVTSAVNIFRFPDVTQFGYHATISNAVLSVYAWRDDSAGTGQCRIYVGLEPAWKNFVDLKADSYDKFSCAWVRNNMPRSTAYTTWNLPAFVQYTQYNSPSFHAAMQEMVNAKWFRGGDIFVICLHTNTGVRCNVEGDTWPNIPDYRPTLSITWTEDATYDDPGFLSLNSRSKISVTAAFTSIENTFDAAARSKLEFIISQAGDVNIDANARGKVDFELSTVVERQMALNVLSKVEMILEADLEKEVLAAARSKVEMILGKLIYAEDIQLKAKSLMEMIIGKELQGGFFSKSMSKLSIDIFNWTEWLNKNRWRAVEKFYCSLVNSDGIVTAQVPIRNFQTYYNGDGSSYISVTLPWSAIDDIRANSYALQIDSVFEVNGVESTSVPILKTEVDRMNIEERVSITLISNFTFNTNRDSAIYVNENILNYSKNEVRETLDVGNTDPFMRPKDFVFTSLFGVVREIKAITYIFGPGYYSSSLELV